MATPLQEFAEIVVDGVYFSDWESVRVEMSASAAPRSFSFSVTEKDDAKITVFNALRIKPGAKVEVFLAGEKVIEGQVWERQAAYDGRNHGVQIIGTSHAMNAVQSNVPMKASQYRGQTFLQIANKLLAPHKLSLRIDGSPEGIEKTFKDISVAPGDTVFGLVERLARQRGMYVYDDVDGSLVATSLGGSGALVGELQEGHNILQLQSVVRTDESAYKMDAVGQQKGGDQVSMDASRAVAAIIQPAAAAAAGGGIYRLIMPEMPGDPTDAKMRLNHERNAAIGSSIDVTVTVQGWFMSNGTHWSKAINSRVHIVSPMALLNHDLFCNQIVMTQDAGGTKTELTLQLNSQGKEDFTVEVPLAQEAPPT